MIDINVMNVSSDIKYNSIKMIKSLNENSG